jgi:hypothetical protein
LLQRSSAASPGNDISFFELETSDISVKRSLAQLDQAWLKPNAVVEKSRYTARTISACKRLPAGPFRKRCILGLDLRLFHPVAIAESHICSEAGRHIATRRLLAFDRIVYVCYCRFALRPKMMKPSSSESERIHNGVLLL